MKKYITRPVACEVSISDSGDYNIVKNLETGEVTECTHEQLRKNYVEVNTGFSVGNVDLTNAQQVDLTKKDVTVDAPVLDMGAEAKEV